MRYQFRLIPYELKRTEFTHAVDFADYLEGLTKYAEAEMNEFADGWEVVSHSLTLTANGEHGVVSVLLRQQTR